MNLPHDQREKTLIQMAVLGVYTTDGVATRALAVDASNDASDEAYLQLGTLLATTYLDLRNKVKSLLPALCLAVIRYPDYKYGTVGAKQLVDTLTTMYRLELDEDELLNDLDMQRVVHGADA